MLPYLDWHQNIRMAREREVSAWQAALKQQATWQATCRLSATRRTACREHVICPLHRSQQTTGKQRLAVALASGFASSMRP
jgi:hypothetical protein